MPQHLWYDSPANHFNEALPVGNGRLGAMFYGGVTVERLHLNEDSLWSGTGPAPVPALARQGLPDIRRLLFADRLRQAHDLAIRTLPGDFSEAYQPVGDLVMELEPGGPFTEFRRELCLKRAIGITTFAIEGIRHTREILVSRPAQVIAVRWSVDRPGALACRLRLNSPQQHQITFSKSGLVLNGRAPSHVEWFRAKPGEGISYNERNGRTGMSFVASLAVDAPGATLRSDSQGIQVMNATELVLLMDIRTSFACETPGADVSATLEKARAVGWPFLKNEHIEDYRALFDRVQLSLAGTDDAVGALTVPDRLRQRDEGLPDPALDTLLFDYGRYLLIASSRPGSQPANLQGLWNCDRQPPWASNYTLNINLEMNYWLAEVCHLPELHEPLFAFIDRLRARGEIVAEKMYDCGGWVAHHQTDVWCSAVPGGFTTGEPNEGASRYALWPMGGAWLTRHLWEHFLYTGDISFLRNRAWPAMKGAATFFLDFLVARADGRLTTAPSTSPENSFALDDGFRAGIATGSTMDLSLLRDLFGNCLAAEHLLGGIDTGFSSRLRSVLARLPPLVVTASGRIAEWDRDYLEWEPRHRHVSHLFGLHPAAEIDPDRTPAFAASACQTLEARTDNGTGWSLAWKINFWARLRDGERAYVLCRKFCNPVPAEKIDLDSPGGLYPNLLCAHPPFQIDGNFGFAAGVTEMLLQSRVPLEEPGRSEIYLLPALPAAWPDGEVSGLRARGGVTVGLRWRDGQLTEARLLSDKPQRLFVRLRGRRVGIFSSPGRPVVLDGSLVARG